MKLSAHNIPVHWSQTDRDQMRRIQPKSIKLIDFHPSRTRDFINLSPGSLFVLRDHPLSEQKADMWANPEKLGETHAERWARNLDTWNLPIPREQIVVCGINEPDVWTDDDPARRNTPRAAGAVIAARYTAALATELAERNIRGLLLNLSVGWPANDGPDTPPDWEPYESIHDAMIDSAVRHGIVHFLGLHEYWSKNGPQDRWGWLAGRYTQCPWDVPILIGECGLSLRVDDFSIPEEQAGWNGNLSKDEYMRQLFAYEAELQKDARIHSAQIFTWDAHAPFIYSDDIRPLLDRLPINTEFGTMTDWYENADRPEPPTEPEPPQSPSEPLLWPIPGAPLSQHFVGNYDWYKAVSAIGHNGTDYAVPEGTPVIAAADGVVQWVDRDRGRRNLDHDGWGWYIRVYYERFAFHGFYAHLNERPPLSAGDVVRRGDVIGFTGNTGRSTGPHLHYSVRLAQRDGAYIATPVNLKGYVDPVIWHLFVNEHIGNNHLFLPLITF